jgi:Domain of unknown function (DUF4328)/Protein of unknown function (DUF2510)
MSSPPGSGTPANWYPDPSGRHQLRYWDGARWTENVSDAGVVGRDQLPPVAPTGVAPAPGGWVQQQPAQPLKGLATALTILLGLTMVAAVATSAALFARASLLDDVFSVSLDELEDADAAAASTAVLFILLFVATGIVWIVWQYRHAKNARLLGQSDGLGPGWAIGGWFIPLGNLVLPQLQLHQAAKATDGNGRGSGHAPPVVIVWWVLFVIAALVGSVTRNDSDADVIDDVSDIEQFQSNDQAAAVGMLVVIVAGVAAILMVRRLTARQHGVLEERGLLQ